MGSSIVMMCSVRVELMWSIIAARLVDFPEPVVRDEDQASPLAGDLLEDLRRRSSRIVWIRTGITRSTRPTVPRCWKTLQRNRPSPGTE